MVGRQKRPGAKTRKGGGRDTRRLQIFISHSHKDQEIARGLVTLIRSSLNLPASEIRCTSVDGGRFFVGIPIEGNIRKEISDARVLIALLSSHSLKSSWVLFELGARWGAGKPLFPLFSGVDPDELKAGPLAGFHSLSCGDEAQMQQFIGNLSKALRKKPEPPTVFQKCLLELVRLSNSKGITNDSQRREFNAGAQREPASLPASTVLRGTIESSPKWDSAWCDLDSPRDLFRGDRLILTLGGPRNPRRRPAEKVLVRLLQIGDKPENKVGIITPTGIHVPDSWTVEVTVPRNFHNVRSVSVHGGERAWDQYLGKGNGPVTLNAVELIAAPNKN